MSENESDLSQGNNFVDAGEFSSMDDAEPTPKKKETAPNNDEFISLSSESNNSKNSPKNSKSNDRNIKQEKPQNIEAQEEKTEHSNHSSDSHTSKKTKSSESEYDQASMLGKKVTPILTSTLTLNQIAYTQDGWIDCTNEKYAMSFVHPILALNFNLKQRSQLLVQLISESEYEIQQTKAEIREARDIIKQLEEMYHVDHLPIDEEEDQSF